MKHEINEIIRNVWELGRVIDERKLFEEAYEIPADEIKRIKWRNVSHLHILGQQESSDLDVLTHGSMRPGIYSASFGSWILILGGTERQIRQAITACSENLELLDVRYTQLVDLDISHLREVKTLWIENNWPLSDVSGLETLRKLQELDISDSLFCESVDLNRFPMLRSLRINRSMVSRIQVSQMLPYMKVFDAYGSRLLDVNCIQFFPYLEYLNLDDTHVSSIPDLMDFPVLKELNLSNIPVTTLKALEYPQSIERLSLGGTDIQRIPECIRNMKNLRYLNLSTLKLKELPLWLADLGLQIQNGFFGNGICLGGTIVDGVDMSLFDQPQEMIRKWFEDRKKGNTIQLNEIKVVFLGDGEAGKSHTIARLINDGGDPIDYTDRSTPGIVIKHKDYIKNDRNIKVHFWDFGGQEILHSMHRIFLTKRTLYVVLVNARDETQDSRARYWLHNVKSFAKDAPVILVLNKIDQNPRANVNERDLRSKYSNLRSVVKLSALEYDQTKFNKEFTDVLLDEIWKTGYLDVAWPVSWTKVKGALEEMRTDYIHGDEYQRICHSYGVDQHRKELLHWFNDLGVSFCCCDEDDYALDDYVILKPDWITNALYIILFNECKGMHNGLIPHKSIYSLLRAAYQNPLIHSVLPEAQYRTEDVQFVLGVIRKFQLSFMGQRNCEFIPMLCQRESTPVAQEYKNDEDTLEFLLKFDYLPNNVLHRLMVERQHELDLDNVWLTGARFKQEETGFSAVVSIDDRTLRIYVKHEDDLHKPNTYLSMLKTTIDYIWQEMGLQKPEYSLVYKLDGVREEFDYEMIRDMRRIGQLRVYSKQWKKMLPIMDILNQSAPEGLVSQSELLKTIVRSCQHIQSDKIYRGSKEDCRNTRMRDDLRMAGYRVYDQTRQGTSDSGKGAGELDLELRTDDDQPWAIIEALRLKHVSATEWKSHIGRLLFNYNPSGVPVLFLIVYVDCEIEKYDEIRLSCVKMIKEFQERHFSYIENSIEHYKFKHINFIKYSTCQYRCGGYSPKVYHIFVHMDPQG